MGRTIAQHVFFKILHNSLPSSANQYREITQICVVWEQKARQQFTEVSSHLQNSNLRFSF